MELSIQSALLNVSDLNESIEFYGGVLDVRVQSRSDRLAALMVSERDRSQVLLLREVGPNAYHAGRGTVGARLIAFEVSTTDELDVVEQRLADRQALVGKSRTEAYAAIFGLDPDRIEVAVSSSLTGAPIRSEDWSTIDDLVYAIE
jgi:catechol-2,3-dioxygenase